ncbi:MAG: hypothetical protein AAF989_14605 [Planctomycetota bacterium]
MFQEQFALLPLVQVESDMPSAIPPAVAQAVQAQKAADQQKIGIAVLAKQLDATKQAGEAINQLLAKAQSQISTGKLDVHA